MKANFENLIFGNVEHVSSIVAKAELTIGSYYDSVKGGAVFRVVIKKVPTAPNCYQTVDIILAEYSGSLNLNYGLTGVKNSPPFQVTENAAKIWKELIKHAESLLIDYIKIE